MANATTAPADKIKMTDLSSFFTRDRAEKGAEMKLVAPTGDYIRDEDGVYWTLTVAGTDSAKFKNAVKEAQSERGRRDDDGVEGTAALVLGWNRMILNGEDLPFTPENVKRVLTDYPFIREQVIAFAANRANFLPKA
ncbi:hypothetical protein VPH49_25475 [Pseudomonas luteola]|uniref:hypothetical protein n=1 Tax=Pseudomonas luteola TaxID=47886 RepID=UPI003A88D0FE